MSGECGSCDGQSNGENGGTDCVGRVAGVTDSEMVRMGELGDWEVWQV